jgi:thiol-disulfide isomerase/thioredoxin
MTRFLRRLALAMIVGCGLPGTTSCADDARPADAILAEFDALTRPKIDPAQVNDPAARSAYLKDQTAYLNAQARLALELYQAHPEHPRAGELLLMRWHNPYLVMQATPEQLLAEADAVLKGTDLEPKVKAEALFLKARAEIQLHHDAPETALPAIEAALAATPDDNRLPGLLYGVSRGLTDSARRTAIEDRILKDFPDATVVGSIRSIRKQREMVGKPLTLEFTDAISGSNVSIAGLKGKVIVVDFWATWCAPCVAEMPTMKRLYAEFKDQGVEFIGVSLDRSETEGGLSALKDFVAKNQIGWPQFYQGNFWKGEFSTTCGIRAVPTVFLVDKNGVLVSVEARGHLEQMIPKLLSDKSIDSD